MTKTFRTDFTGDLIRSRKVSVQSNALPALREHLGSRKKARSIPFQDRSLTYFAFIFGLLLQCNIVTTSLGLRFLHITDILVLAGFFILPALYIWRISLRLLLAYAGPLTVLLILTTLLGYDRGDGEYYSTAFTFIYAVFSIFFLHILVCRDQLDTFCVGSLLGFLLSVIFLALDANGIPLAEYGLAFAFDADEVIQNAIRYGDSSGGLLMRLEKAGGIWSTGNEAGPVLALAAAPAAYLAERTHRTWIYALFVAFFMFSFLYTLNRSGLIAVTIIGIILYARLFSRRLFLWSCVGFAMGVTTLMAVTPFGVLDPVWEAVSSRLFQDSNANGNISDRLMSTWAGIEVALKYPFGIGTTARIAEMGILSHIITPHNGFIAASYVSGVGPAAMLILATFYTLVRRRKNRFFLYAALAMTVGFLFEELAQNPAFMMYMGLTLAYAAKDLNMRLRLADKADLKTFTLT